MASKAEHREVWKRKATPADYRQAADVRAAFVSHRLYPVDPEAVDVAQIVKPALHGMVDALQPADAWALYQVVQALVLTGDQVSYFVDEQRALCAPLDADLQALADAGEAASNSQPQALTPADPQAVSESINLRLALIALKFAGDGHSYDCRADYLQRMRQRAGVDLQRIADADIETAADVLRALTVDIDSQARAALHGIGRLVL